MEFYMKYSIIQTIIYSLFCCNIVIASLFFGAVHDTFWPLLCASSLICFLLSFSHTKSKDVNISPSLTICIILFIGYLILRFYIKSHFSLHITKNIANIFQSMNITNSFKSMTGGYYEKINFYKWLIPITTFLICPVIFYSKKRISQILKIICIIGCFQGIYGIIQYVTGKEPFFVRP